jgi:hypothetical protein
MSSNRIPERILNQPNLKMIEMMERFCFLIPIICLNKPNTGEDNDDDDGGDGYHNDDNDHYTLIIQ